MICFHFSFWLWCFCYIDWEKNHAYMPYHKCFNFSHLECCCIFSMSNAQTCLNWWLILLTYMWYCLRQDRAKAVEILVKDLKVFSSFNEELFKEITQLLTLENFRFVCENNLGSATSKPVDYIHTLLYFLDILKESRASTLLAKLHILS